MSMSAGAGNGIARDLKLDIPAGDDGSKAALNKFGHSADIDTAAEEVWDGGTAYSGFLAAATTMSAISTSDEDGPSAGGTGALTITIEGLAADYTPLSATLTMNGTTTTTETGTAFLRVFRAYVVTAGTALSNVGTITIASTTPTTVAVISATKGQTLMAIYTVPAGKTLYITQWYVTTGKADDAFADLFKRELGGAWRIQHSQSVYQGQALHPFNPYLKFTEKTDIKVMALSSNLNTVASAGFDGVLVTN